MATNTYKAQLNYHDSRWGWGNEGTASQGAWDGTGTRTGVLYFPGLASLKNKIINSVRITVTTGQTGWGLATTKTVSFYRSAAQGGIKTSLNANHKTGSAIGSVKGAMYNNTVTYTVAFLAARIAAGDDTYCIYNGSSSTDYLKWTSVSLEVNWSEPATQPSLSKSTVEMGTAVTISTPAANGGYRHTLRYAFGSASGTIASGVASAQSWTPPVSLAAQIPSATSGSGAIYCDTYSGSTLLGTKSVSITLTVPASVRPTAGTLSAAVADDSSGTGMYVKGMGKARVTLSGAAGAQGSSIRSTVISGGGWSASGTTLLTGVLTAAGTVTFMATVTDSRGRTASTTTSISVIDYARPGISSCTVYRCNSAGARQNDGTYAAVEIKAFYSAISGNTLSLGVAYKRSSESGYGGSTALTNNGKTIIGGGGLSASTTYDVRVTVSDKYNTVEQVYRLPTKSVLLSFLKNLGAAIGKVAELPGWLDIGLNTRIREDLQVDGSITTAGITTADTREVNSTPEEYMAQGRRITTEFKNCSAVGLSGTETYGTLTTIVQWNDSSGGYPKQILVTAGRMYIRTGISNTTWGNWSLVLVGGDLAGYAQLASPNNLVHSGNECTFIPSGFSSALWFNYRTVGGTNGSLSQYNFGRGNGGGLADINVNSVIVSDKTTTLSNLGAMPLSYGQSVALWTGVCNRGSSITIPNANKYGALIVYCTPGSGESEVITCIYRARSYKFQIASNQTYCLLSATDSGDNKVFTVDSGSSSGATLNGVYGLSRFKS